jgi:hypothetical protein
MAAGLLPDEGIGETLSNILSTPFSGLLPWLALLWVNDYVPTSATTLADLVEASWSGYYRQTLTRGGWSAPVVTSGCAKATWGSDPIVLSVGTILSPTINYGIAYYDPGYGVLRYVQRFDDADLFPLVSGGLYKFLPQFTLTSAEC